MGIITHLNGDYDRAQSLLEEGLGCAQAANDQWIAAFAILNLGYVDRLRGFYREGYHQMMKGLETWRALGDPHSISMGLNFVVPTLIHLGRYEEARTSMSESIALCEQTHNRWGMGTACRFLGLVLAEEGRYVEAETQLQTSLEIFREYVEGWDIARTLSYLGDVTLKSGGLMKAKAFYLDALSLAIHARAIPIAMDSLIGLAELGVRNDEPGQAYELCKFVLHHPASTKETKDRASHLELAIDRCLTAEQIEILQIKGEIQSLEIIANELLSK